MQKLKCTKKHKMRTNETMFEAKERKQREKESEFILCAKRLINNIKIKFTKKKKKNE